MTDSLRARQQEATRATILAALMDLIERDGVAGFSVQSVADVAGVAHRTVYRHFPSREALLEGLGLWLNEHFTKALGLGPTERFPNLEPGVLGEVAETGFGIFEKNAKLAATYVILAVGGGIRLPSRVQRTRWFEKVLAPNTEHLSRKNARAAAVLIRTIASATTWHHIREHSETDPKAAARAVRWAIETLARELAAGGGPGKEPTR